jgi:histidinol-phosphate aminotransferase
MDISKWVRPNILKLKPYSSARDEFSGEAMVFLDANENPFNKPYNRYPDPLSRELKNRIASLKGISDSKIFLGNGSDEPIDLIIRLFCEPGIHNIVTFEPTYGMYQVAADIHDIAVQKVKLTADYQLDAEELLNLVNPNTRIIFLCSPNNPTGNVIDEGVIHKIATEFNGIVVLDEAYIDFAPEYSWLKRLDEFPNLIILQTLSKAWGMAGIRLGMAFCQSDIVGLLNKIKYPYNLNILTQKKALELLGDLNQKESWVKLLLEEKKKLEQALTEIPFVKKVFPSNANFLLVKMDDAQSVYQFLIHMGIVVRDRSVIILCENSLRITVGTPEENRILLESLRVMGREKNKE